MNANRTNSQSKTAARSVHPTPDHSDRSAWLLVYVDERGHIHDWLVLSTNSAIAAVEDALTDLQQLPAWQTQTEGRVGPFAGRHQTVWHAQWLGIPANDARWSYPLAAARTGVELEYDTHARLIHLETSVITTEDVTSWLNRCPDIVIGRDANHQPLFVNDSGTEVRDPALIDQLSRIPLRDSSTGRGRDEVQVSDVAGRLRFFQRTLMPAPFAMTVDDFVIAHEVTASKEMEHALGDNERLMRLLIDATPDFIAIKDAEGRWLLANEAGLRLYHLRNKPWWGKTDLQLAELTHPVYRECFKLCHHTDLEAWAAGSLSRDIETVPMVDGGERTFDVLKLPVFGDEHERRVLIVIGRDITERKQAEDMYRRLATHDELTGLLNRRFFQEESERRLADAERSEQQLALILVDLDQFKTINDRYGHNRGDQLLVQLAERMTGCIHRSGALIARMDGDEFALLLPDLRPDNTELLTEIISRINEMTRRPFLIDGMTLFISASIGIARAPSDGRSIVGLMQAADSALAEAKALGRDKHVFFSHEIAERQAWKSDMLSALRRGLEEDRFELHYQVQQNARSLAITGVEALLRWNPPAPELAAGPERFIPMLEETGLIIEVGNWVLRTACAQAVAWANQLGERISMAVNVSSLQLHAPGFVEQVHQAILDSGIEPNNLELELTESALVNDPDKAMATLAAIKALGVKLSLDDFGTGYSSLSYLTRFSFDRLKIDKSFIRDLLTDPNDLEIVKAIIAMGHALGLDVIAEGVELIVERDLLESLGCDYFQGFLVGRPGAPDHISPMLGVGLL